MIGEEPSSEHQATPTLFESLKFSKTKKAPVFRLEPFSKYGR